jgi:23S rRNA U2552 (ribose-2'-O)-methylase RlmE/FtsJ
MSDDFTKARDALRAMFDEVKTYRPETVRKNSFEVFLVAKAKRLVTVSG